MYKSKKVSTLIILTLVFEILWSNLWISCTSAAAADTASLNLNGTSLALQAAEQNISLPSIEKTYAYDRVQQFSLQIPGATDDPYDGYNSKLTNAWDQQVFVVDTFFNDPGLYISIWTKRFLRDVIRPLARKLSALLLIFVLNPNIAADGLRGAKTDVQALFNQTADVMFYIAVDLSLILFVLAIWRHWSDSAWKGRSGGWMSAIGRLVFTIALIILWKTLYTLELDLTNEMIKAVWFNDPAQRNLLVSTIEKAFVAILTGTGGLALSTFAPFMGALGGSIVGGPTGMIVGGAGGTIVALVGWLLFIVFGVVIITEVVYVLVLKAVQEALLAAQFLVGYIFLVCFASPDTEHVASGFVRSFIEVSLWSFVWLILLKVLTIVLNASDKPSGAQILLIIGVLQIMIQVPKFMQSAQISPISEFLTAGAVTGLVSKGLTGATESIKKVVTDISDYQLNAKYASVGTPETTPTTLKMPQHVADEGIYARYRAATQPAAAQMARPANSTPQAGAETTVGAEAADASNSAAAQPLSANENSGVPTSETSSNLTPPVKAGRNLDTPGAGANDAANAAGADKGNSAGSSGPRTGAALPPAKLRAEKAAPASPTNAAESDTENTDLSADSTVVTPASTPVTASAAPTAAAPATPPDKPLKGLNRILANYYTNARMRPWEQDLNDGTNMAQKGKGDQSTIHMGERGARFVEYAADADEEEMGFTVAVAGMASDLANNPRGRDAARKAVMSRHLDQPRTLGEHVAAAAVYTAKGQHFNQTKLGQSRGQLGMLDELAAGSAHYLTLGEAGHENEVTTLLNDTFKPYDEPRQAATIAQMTDEDSTESGINRGNSSSTHNVIGHGFQVNDLSRAVYAGHLVAGTRIGQRDKANGMYNYIETLANKPGTHMGNDEAQPWVNGISAEEANACMVIARAEGPEACRNVGLVQAVASMGRGTNPGSYESAFAALDAQVQHNNGGVPTRLADAQPTEIAGAAQTVQQLRRAGFNDNQLNDPGVLDVVDELKRQAGGTPAPALVQAVLGSNSHGSGEGLSHNHVADQVLKNLGAQPTAQNRQVVVRMLDEGYEAKDIQQKDFQIAGAVVEQGGYPSPEFVNQAQAQGYTPGQKLSHHTMAQGIVARLGGANSSENAKQVDAVQMMLDNRVAPDLINNDMIETAMVLRANNVTHGAINTPNLLAARELLANNTPPEMLKVANLTAAMYVSPGNLDGEGMVAARHMLDADFTAQGRHSISNQELFVGKGLVAEKIEPRPDIIDAVINHPDYQANPYQYNVTPSNERAQIPQAIVAHYAPIAPLPEEPPQDPHPPALPPAPFVRT